jgi:hypothetical protein
MGTTITTNLGLIKPDVDESIKQNLPTFNGWSAQNAANMDKVDALFRMAGATYTLNWTADTTAPTLGAGGFTEGKYLRVTPRLVIVFFRLYAGTAGFLPGSSTYKFNLPTGIAPEFNTVADNIPCGKATLLDNSTVLSSSNMGVVYIPSTQRFFMRPTVGGVFNGVNPIAFTNDDRVSGYLMYPTADA